MTTRKTKAERDREYEAEVQQEMGAILLTMDRKPDQPIERDAWRAEHAKRGNTAVVEALDRLRDDISHHNRKAGPGFIEQRRAAVEKDVRERDRASREKVDRGKVSRLVEEGRARSAGIRPRAFGEASDENWNPGAMSPTKSRKRNRKKGPIGGMSPGANPGPPAA